MLRDLASSSSLFSSAFANADSSSPLFVLVAGRRVSVRNFTFLTLHSRALDLFRYQVWSPNFFLDRLRWAAWIRGGALHCLAYVLAFVFCDGLHRLHWHTLADRTSCFVGLGDRNTNRISLLDLLGVRNLDGVSRLDVFRVRYRNCVRLLYLFGVRDFDFVSISLLLSVGNFNTVGLSYHFLVGNCNLVGDLLG